MLFEVVAANVVYPLAARMLYVTQRYSHGAGSAGEDTKHLRDQLTQAEQQV